MLSPDYWALGPQHIRLARRSNWPSPTVNPRFERLGDNISGEFPDDARTKYGVSSMPFQRVTFAGPGPVAIGHATPRDPGYYLRSCNQLPAQKPWY